MGKSPSQFEETIQHQFDRLCKLALKGEKIDYIRHMEYLRKNEVIDVYKRQVLKQFLYLVT